MANSRPPSDGRRAHHTRARPNPDGGWPRVWPGPLQPRESGAQPALPGANVPDGGLDWPRSSRPQHSHAPSNARSKKIYWTGAKFM